MDTQYKQLDLWKGSSMHMGNYCCRTICTYSTYNFLNAVVFAWDSYMSKVGLNNLSGPRQNQSLGPPCIICYPFIWPVHAYAMWPHDLTYAVSALQYIAFYLSYRSVCVTIYFTFLKCLWPLFLKLRDPLRPGALGRLPTLPTHKTGSVYKYELCNMCIDAGVALAPHRAQDKTSLRPPCTIQYMLPIYMICPYACDCITLRTYNCCFCTSFLS